MESTAQDSVYVVSYIEVAPNAAAPSAALLERYGAASRNDTGIVRLEVLQRAAPPHQFAIVSIWADHEAFEAHRDAVHSRRLAADLQPHLIAPFDVRAHTALAAAPRTAVPTGARPVFIVTHVDVPPPSKDRCIEALDELVEASRREPGAARFEVFRQTGRPNHFTVVEVWQDEAAYHTHLTAAHTKRFRDVLTPMTGALYDERRHRAI
jgi:quinol monooxygenase YgiN